MRTIVEVAHAHATFPVLVTQAHSTNPQIAFAYGASGIAHFSELLRDAASKFGDRALLVDLDRMTTGIHEEFFTDVGHHDWEGVKFEGRALAEAVHLHWSSR